MAGLDPFGQLWIFRFTLVDWSDEAFPFCSGYRAPLSRPREKVSRLSRTVKVCFVVFPEVHSPYQE
jgi:hypothetical protein